MGGVDDVFTEFKGLPSFRGPRRTPECPASVWDATGWQGRRRAPSPRAAGSRHSPAHDGDALARGMPSHGIEGGIQAATPGPGRVSEAGQSGIELFLTHAVATRRAGARPDPAQGRCAVGRAPRRAYGPARIALAGSSGLGPRRGFAEGPVRELPRSAAPSVSGRPRRRRVIPPAPACASESQLPYDDRRAVRPSRRQHDALAVVLAAGRPPLVSGQTPVSASIGFNSKTATPAAACWISSREEPAGNGNWATAHGASMRVT